MMQNNDTVSRLTRIENKVDRMTESLVMVARVEERIATMLSSMTEVTKRLNRHSERLDVLEVETVKSQSVGRIFGRVAWIVLTATVGVLVGANGILG
tara:strand:- start:3208 stop:3498 length:291 start_codon:yes stop_codon:yes gene_type:complete